MSCSSPRGDFRAHYYGRCRSRKAPRLACRRCGERVPASFRARRARWERARRARLLQAARCGVCGAPELASAGRCARCLRASNEGQRATRAALRAAGRCCCCRDPIEAGWRGSMCARCRADRQAKKQAILARGICPACQARPLAAKPGGGAFRRCGPCLAAGRERIRAAYQAGRSTWHKRRAGLPIASRRRALPARPACRSVYLPPAGSLALALAWAERRRRP